MTSPLLRNLRTTLWSTLPKTSRNLRGTLCSDRIVAFVALVATFAVATSVNTASAQETAGRAVLADPANPLPSEFMPGETADAASYPERSPRLPMIPVEAGEIKTPRKASRTQGWRGVSHEHLTDAALQTSEPGHAKSSELSNSALTMPLSRNGEVHNDRIRRKALVSASESDLAIQLPDPDAATSARASMEVTTPPAAPEFSPPAIGTWQDEYSYYIDQVLPSAQCRSNRESENVGAWWHHESERFIMQNREIVSERPGQMKSAAKAFIADHTLQPERNYAVDIYDQNPIAVGSSEVAIALNPPLAEADYSQDSDDLGKNRLRTDIRKIRPTLSYAMKNIKQTQLPDGFNERLDHGEYIARQSSPAVLQWAPTNLYHYPLYFEDFALERYGHTYHPVVQPFASAGLFATQLAGLPYQMTLHPVHAHEYALGYYRPGECAPKKHYQIPFNEEAAVMQAAAIVGFFLIFP